MIARPDIGIANIEELFADEIGQLWSPATVAVTWPPVTGLRAPSLAINVIAPARADMTIQDLRQAHLQAARDVLSAAVLSLEEPLGVRRPLARAGRRSRAS